ncbi:FixH family protein [Neobacillus massiliamazoniensis]|uniref:Copper resistance protein CopC n=1 Tax=Neobacillus massiliamazoniensis TaxID=1499688 RepID=A0A0U1NZ28_9BACI|nr:FixH family protein [Neobacillus massiliamazoniensis]CRK83245.1 copper resistance protein CopC [Neobacillus massiliamazoniensis]
MNNRKCFSIVISVICLILFSFPPLIYAHAYIIKSNPYNNEVLKQSPQKVSIQFNETIQSVNNSIQIYDEKGNRVDQKNGGINPKNSTILECGLNHNLPNSAYRIQWKVISNDGHPVQGVISFQIGPGNKAKDGTTVSQKSNGYTPLLDLIIIRWIQYFSNACYVGILFFYLLIMPNELAQNEFVKTRFLRIINFSFLFLLFSILLNLPLMASIELTTSWSNVLNVQTLMDMVRNTALGKIWILQVDDLFFLSIFTYLLNAKKFNKPLFPWISFIFGIGLLLTKALTGHSFSRPNPTLPIGMDFLHLLAASIWIGSLVGIIAFFSLSKMMETKNLYFEILRRFSKWGTVIVLVLTTTGVFGAFLNIPNLSSLVYTDYGNTLLGKVILLVVMIIIAAINFLKGKRKKEKGLSTSLWSELITGMIVLLLSVILTNLPTAMASPGPENVTKIVEHAGSITLNITPNAIGENTLQVSLKDQNGQAMSNIEQVTLTLTSMERGMGDDTITLHKGTDGIYKAKGMDLNMAGRWNVHVHVLTKELNTIDTDIRIIVGSQ